jgi:hypothetical protein
MRYSVVYITYKFGFTLYIRTYSTIQYTIQHTIQYTIPNITRNVIILCYIKPFLR